MRTGSLALAMGTAPHTLPGGVLCSNPAPPSPVPVLLQVVLGTSTTADALELHGGAALPAHPGKGCSSPGITWRAQQPGHLQSTPAPGVLDRCWQPLPLQRVPHGQGRQSGRVSARFSGCTTWQLSPAPPHRSSLRHKAAAAPGCWQRRRARAWAAAGTRQRLRPRLSPGFGPRENTP